MSAVLLVYFILILSCEQDSCQDRPGNITSSPFRRKNTIDNWWYEYSCPLTTNSLTINTTDKFYIRCSRRLERPSMSAWEQTKFANRPGNITSSPFRGKKNIDDWWHEYSGSLTTKSLIINTTDRFHILCLRSTGRPSMSAWEQTKFASVRRKIQPDNTSKPFQPVEYFSEKSPPSGPTSSTGFEVYHAIYTGVIILVLVIIVVSFKRYVDWRLRRVDNGTENEHEPLHNQNGDPCIPMADLNDHRTHVLCELQASDLGHNGNTDANRDLLEGQRKSESITGSQSNDSFHAAGQFCRCCGHHRTRCKKSNKVQRIAPVQPQQSVNEMPTTETHGSTNTLDEETTYVKSVYSNEQVSSTVEQNNEAEGTCFEESQQPGLHNEDHMTTGIPAEGDLSQADSLLGRTNHDEV